MVEKDILQVVNNSRTTDITTIRKTVVYSQALGRAREYFIADVDLLSSTTSENITSNLVEVLRTKKMHLPCVTGLETDGDAVLTGQRTGVGTRLKEVFCPKVVQVPCIAHCLALASGQAANTVNLFKKYQTTVNWIYNYFQQSSTWIAKL